MTSLTLKISWQFQVDKDIASINWQAYCMRPIKIVQSQHVASKITGLLRL